MGRITTRTEVQLPDAGEGRWWRVTHQPKNRTKPMRIELMESMTPGREPLSTMIGYEDTIASEKALNEAAELVLTRSASYDQLVGSYGIKKED